MPTNALTLSTQGLERLKKHEASIDGLYDDPSGYATYGVGHLVHTTDKWKSLLLDSAQSDKLCDSRVKKQWPGTVYETTYLEREAIGCTDYDALKTKAKERALETVARAKFKKAFKDLDEKTKAATTKAAEDAVDREVQLLNLTVANVLQSDLKPFEKAVNDGVTGVTLTQDEFDALVSFVFNVGAAAFKGSTLLKKINEGKHRSGEAADREKAIAQIETAFLAWNKSGGKELNGLTTRRQDEADRFLKQARDELAESKAAKGGKGSWLVPAPNKRGASMLAVAAVRGLRPDRVG